MASLRIVKIPVVAASGNCYQAMFFVIAMIFCKLKAKRHLKHSLAMRGTVLN